MSVDTENTEIRGVQCTSLWFRYTMRYTLGKTKWEDEYSFIVGKSVRNSLCDYFGNEVFSLRLEALSNGVEFYVDISHKKGEKIDFIDVRKTISNNVYYLFAKR